MITALRCFVLILSLLGYGRMIGTHIRTEFVPGILISGLGCVMSLAGIAGILPSAAYAVIIGGMICFAISVRRHIHLHFSDILLTALCLWFFWSIYGTLLTGYDDFSHWGVITRILVMQERLPIAEDALLTFQSYPPGSAALIYYFVKSTGICEEWFWLWTQAAATLSMWMALFVFAKERKQRLFLSAVMLVLLCSNTFFINLLVDGLLSAVAVGGMCFWLYYRDRVGKKLLCLIPYVAFLTLIKSSGLFYAMLLLICALTNLKHDLHKSRYSLAVILFSLLPILLWRVHVRLTFPQGMLSKHALSIEYFLKTGADKTWPGVKYILVQFLKSVFSPAKETLWLMLFAGCIMILYHGRVQDRKKMINVTRPFILLSGAVYLLLLAVMYLISMPWSEASVLAGLERYLRTFTVMAAALLSVSLMKLSDGERKTILCLLWIPLLAVSMRVRPDFYLRWPMELEPRTAFEKLIREEGMLQNGEKCLILVSGAEADTEYLSYMARYVLNSPDVDVIEVESEEEKVDETVEQNYERVIHFQMMSDEI